MAKRKEHIGELAGNKGEQGIGIKLKKWGVLSVLKNKYFIAGISFAVWMLFFDPKDLSSELGRRQKYNELQASEKQMLMQIKSTKEELGELKNNAQTIEKYAREKYFMKKENEDLFIVGASKE